MQIDALERISSMNAVEWVGSIKVVEPKGSRDYSKSHDVIV